MRVDQLAHERGAALVLQRDVGDAPAVVLGADAVRDRHAHVGEEHLGELRDAEHGLERPHLDAGQVHRQDQPRDAAVLRRVGIGAHEELADVGDLAERAPDLLAVEHVVVAVALGPGPQRREIGAGARLGEALAPHLVAAQDLRQVVGLLRVAALFDQRRARVQRADEVDADVRRAGARRLFVEDQLLGRRRAAAAVLRRPVQARVAGVEQAPLPIGVPLAALGPGVARAAGARARAARPRARRASSRAKRFVGVRVAKLHGGGSLRVGLAGAHRPIAQSSAPSVAVARRGSRRVSTSTTATTRAAGRGRRRREARGSGPGRTARPTSDRPVAFTSAVDRSTSTARRPKRRARLPVDLDPLEALHEEQERHRREPERPPGSR